MQHGVPAHRARRHRRLRPAFRVAGDDVDICWRLQQRGGRSASVPPRRLAPPARLAAGLLRQQRGYGRAEALLERKWPARYNRGGHLSWAGRVYGGARPRAAAGGARASTTARGGAARSSRASAGRSRWASLTAMPEWYFVIGSSAASPRSATCGGRSSSSRSCSPPSPRSSLHALVAAAQSRNGDGRRRGGKGLPPPCPVALLHVAQPLARLAGRIRHGLAPWRRPRHRAFALPCPASAADLERRWCSLDERLDDARGAARAALGVVRGNAYARWDLQARAGFLGVVPATRRPRGARPRATVPAAPFLAEARRGSRSLRSHGGSSGSARAQPTMRGRCARRAAARDHRWARLRALASGLLRRVVAAVGGRRPADDGAAAGAAERSTPPLARRPAGERRAKGARGRRRSCDGARASPARERGALAERPARAPVRAPDTEARASPAR